MTSVKSLAYLRWLLVLPIKVWCNLGLDRLVTRLFPGRMPVSNSARPVSEPQDKLVTLQLPVDHRRPRVTMEHRQRYPLDTQSFKCVSNHEV